MADLGPILIDPSGEIVEVSPEEASSALAQGYAPASPKQVEEFGKARAFHEKYGGAGGTALAGLAGAARGLTFGLSDVALTKSGAVEPATLEGLKEEHPIAEAVGQGLGIALPILATAGAAAPAAGVKGALQTAASLTGPGLAMRAGQAATRAAQQALTGGVPTSLASHIAARAIATGAGSAVEGAFYGAGQDVSEAALGDRNITVQSLLAHAGPMAVLGGGLGSIIGAAEVAVPAALKGAADSLSSAVAKAKEAYPGFQERFTGIPADQVREGMAKYAAAFKDPREVVRLERNLGGALEDVANHVEKAQKKMYGLGRPIETETLLAGLDPAVLAEKAAVTRERVAGVLAEATKAARADDDLVLGKVVGEIEKIATGFERRTQGLAPLDIFENLRTARRQLGDLGDWMKTNREMPPLAKENAVKMSRDLYGVVRDALVDENTWGAAGVRHAVLDEAKHTYENALHALTGGKLSPLNSNILPKAIIDGKEQFQLSPRALRTALNQMGDPRGDRVADAIVKYLDSSGKFINAMEDTYKYVPTGSFDKTGLLDLVNKTGELTQQARTQAEATRFLRELDPNAGLRTGGANALLPPTGNTGVAGGIGTAIVGAPIVGALVPGAGPLVAAYGTLKAGYHAYQGMKNVPQMVATLASLERVTQRISNAIDTASSTLVRGSVKASNVSRAETSAGIAREFGSAPEDATKRFQRRVGEVQRYAQDPEALHRALTAQAQSLEAHAPQTSQALSIASARAVAFLASKVPQDPQRGPLAPKWTPSQTEVSKFARYYEAVNDPLVILKQAAAGTLTTEAVEAVQTVYPDLYARIQAAIVEKLAAHSGTVPYRSRMALSQILGQDVDGSLLMLAANQAAHQGPSRKQNAAPQPQAIKTSSVGLGRISLSTRSMTPQQASASRR